MECDADWVERLPLAKGQSFKSSFGKNSLAVPPGPCAVMTVLDGGSALQESLDN